MWCKTCRIETNEELCPICGSVTIEDLPTEVYWCAHCAVPVIQVENQADKGEITKPNEKVGPAFWMSPEAVDCSYFQSDLVGTYSDVFQLCAVFVFVLTKRFPGGIIHELNDLNTTPEIREVLIRSLSNDYSQRPVDGSDLAVQYNNATYARA